MIRKGILASILGLIMVFQLFAQTENLVLNPNLEKFIDCPDQNIKPSFIMSDYVNNWINANGSADYYNTCSKNSLSEVPKNLNGYQILLSGNGYVGMFCFKTSCEYIQGVLKKNTEKRCVLLYWF